MTTISQEVSFVASLWKTPWTACRRNNQWRNEKQQKIIEKR